MKFIELTVIADTNEKAWVNMDSVRFVLDNNTSSALVFSDNERTLSVAETPQQIADLVNGNQKESGWIEHTTDTIPFSDNELVVVEHGDGLIYAGNAIGFRWKKLNINTDIAYYKIIERRTK